MATPWKDMEVAFWDFLGGQATYTSIGLTEFRGYDGNYFPWDKDGGAQTTVKLPAFSGELESSARVRVSQSGFEDTVILALNLFHSSAGVDNGRAVAEADLAAILDLLDSRSNFPKLGSTSINRYEVGDVTLAPIKTDGTDKAAQWRWSWQIQLFGNRRQIA